MTTENKQQPKSSQPVAKPAIDAPPPLQVQCFTHSGEVVVVFSRPVSQWFLPADAAREFARVFTEAAAVLDAQEASRSTKQ